MTTLLLVVIYIAFISLGLPDSMLGAAWPVMQNELGLPLAGAGLVSMIVSGGTIVSSLFSGMLIHQLGTGKLTLFSVLMTALALLGYSFESKTIFGCACIAVPLGLGAGAVDAALNDFVARNFAARHMNWLHSFLGYRRNDRSFDHGVHAQPNRSLANGLPHSRHRSVYIGGAACHLPAPLAAFSHSSLTADRLRQREDTEDPRVDPKSGGILCILRGRSQHRAMGSQFSGGSART